MSAGSAPAPRHGVDRLLLAGALLALLLAAMNQTIVAIAVPAIVADLGGADRLSWIVTGYLLFMTVAMPLCGKLADLVGRRAVLLGSTVVFLAASIVCTVSASIEQLALFRAVQGIGAGGLIVGAQVLAADLAPPRERGKYLALLTGVFSVASVAGPLVGGALVDSVSWRATFVVNVPLGLLAALLIRRTPRQGSAMTRRALDLRGAAMLTVALSATVLAITWGGSSQAWGSTPVVGVAGAAAVAFAAFVREERRASDPLVPLALFASRTFVVATAMGALVGGSMFSALTFIPVLLQLVHGMGPTTAGLWLLPIQGGALLGGAWGAVALRRCGRYRAITICGMAATAAGLLLFAATGTDGGMVLPALAMTILGIGISMAMQTLLVAVQSDVDAADVGTATSVTALARTLGGAIGVAVYGMVFTLRFVEQLDRLPSEVAGRFAGGTEISREAIRGLPAGMRDEVIVAVGTSLQTVFVLIGAAAVAAFALSWLLRDATLDGGQPRPSHAGADRTRGGQPGVALSTGPRSRHM